MWTSEQFAAWLAESHGADAFRDRVQSRMKQIALMSLTGAQDAMDPRPKSFELYGCAAARAHGE